MLNEAHKLRFSIHLGAKKIYHDLRHSYYMYEKVYSPLRGAVSDLPEGQGRGSAPLRKVPSNAKGLDAIGVIVDRLTRSANFLSIRESSSAEKLSDIYVPKVVARHGAPTSIVSDRDAHFTSIFWKRFHEELGT